MKALSVPELLKLIAKHPHAETELLAWHKVARSASWTSLIDVPRHFPSAGLVGMVLSFDILSDDLRLLTVASWPSQRIYIKALLTHRQYDRKEWVKQWAY